MLNLTIIKKVPTPLLLLLLLCMRETASHPQQLQQPDGQQQPERLQEQQPDQLQQQQQQQQEEQQAQHLLSVNEKQVRTIVNYMDQSVNPCDDFFTYTCGNWSNYHNTTRYFEVTGLIDHKLNKKFALLLENFPTRAGETDWWVTDQDIVQMVWTYYKSCRHARFLDLKRYLQLVRPAERLNWPLLHDSGTWPSERFSWWLTLAKLRRYGLQGTIIEHLVLAKLKDSGEYIISLDKGSIETELPMRTAGLKMFMSLGLSAEQAAQKFDQIEALEGRIKELIENQEDEYDANEDYELSVQYLRRNLPQLAWRKYFALVLDDYVLQDNFTVNIANWGYFVKIVELLDRTEPEIVCNYIMIMFMKHLFEDSTSGFDKIDCVVDARSKMDVAVNYIYRQRFYKPEADVFQEGTENLLQRLRVEFQKLLDENRLQFQPAEVDLLKEKLRTIRINFGNLPSGYAEGNERNESMSEYVANYYKDLSLDPRNYYKNHLALLELRFKKQHQMLQPAKGSDYVYITESDVAQSSTPYYLMRQNIIVVPFGNFQPPIYHKNMHDLLKISLFGFLLAHELVHGFDYSGITFDYRGDAQELSQNMTDNENFSRGMECLGREKTDSMDERIADVVAVRLAYEAYFGQQEVDPAASVPFADFSMRRLFFLNMVQFFCGSQLGDFIDHDSDEVRVRQTLKNFEPFAEEFGCNMGDAMHPREKCRLY